jgi:YggT family protein
MTYILGRALYIFCRALELAILIRVIISYLPAFNKINSSIFMSLLRDFTDPVLIPIRNLLQRFKYNLGVDISPIIAFLIINFIERIALSIR